MLGLFKPKGERVLEKIKKNKDKIRFLELKLEDATLGDSKRSKTQTEIKKLKEDIEKMAKLIIGKDGNLKSAEPVKEAVQTTPVNETITEADSPFEQHRPATDNRVAPPQSQRPQPQRVMPPSGDVPPMRMVRPQQPQQFTQEQMAAIEMMRQEQIRQRQQQEELRQQQEEEFYQQQMAQQQYERELAQQNAMRQQMAQQRAAQQEAMKQQVLQQQYDEQEQQQQYIQEQQQLRQQYVKEQPQQQEDEYYKIVIKMVQGDTFTVNVLAKDIAAFTQELDEAINTNGAFTLGKETINGRHVLFYKTE